MSSASEGLAKKRKNPAIVKKRHTGTSVMSYIATPNRDSGSVGAAGRDANLFRCGESCAFECQSGTAD